MLADDVEPPTRAQWFESEPNPKNCSIRVIRGSVNRGYVYLGTEDPRAGDSQDVLLKSSTAVV
jgi:hypothetical protein